MEGNPVCDVSSSALAVSAQDLFRRAGSTGKNKFVPGRDVCGFREEVEATSFLPNKKLVGGRKDADRPRPPNFVACLVLGFGPASSQASNFLGLWIWTSLFENPAGHHLT